MTKDRINYILKYYYYYLNDNQNSMLNKLHYVQDYHNLSKEIEDQELKAKILQDLELTMTDIVEYSSDKDEYFKEKIATEIFNLHFHEIELNLCPVCGELARTPIAKSAKCGHAW